MAVCLSQYYFIPYDKVSEYFRTVHSLSLSTGSIVNFVAATSDNLASTEQMIKDVLKKTPLLAQMKLACGPKANSGG